MKKEELLHNYFLDALSPKELSEFESLLEKDPEFSEQFEFEKSVKKVIKAKKRKDLKSKLETFEKEIASPKKGKVISWKPLQIAASIAVLVSLGVYLISQFNTESIEYLYADHYEKYPNTVFPIKRGNDQQPSSILFKAFLAYESDNDIEAITLFKELQQTENFDHVDFYLGQSYLKANQIENAIATFNKIIGIDQKFTDEARWYLGLAYLKNKDTQNAIKILKEVVAKGGYMSKEAKGLLEVMD